MLIERDKGKKPWWYPIPIVKYSLIGLAGFSIALAIFILYLSNPIGLDQTRVSTFEMVLVSKNIFIEPGTSQQLAIMIRPIGDYKSDTTLSVQGLPRGVVISFSPMIIPPSSKLAIATIKVLPNVAPGKHMLFLSAISTKGEMKNETINLTIDSGPVEEFKPLKVTIVPTALILEPGERRSFNMIIENVTYNLSHTNIIHSLCDLKIKAYPPKGIEISFSNNTRARYIKQTYERSFVVGFDLIGFVRVNDTPLIGASNIPITIYSEPMGINDTQYLLVLIKHASPIKPGTQPDLENSLDLPDHAGYAKSIPKAERAETTINPVVSKFE